jgi:hypothetical protein
MRSMQGPILFGLMVVVAGSAGVYLLTSVQQHYSASRLDQMPLTFDRVLRYEGRSLSLTEWVRLSRRFPQLSIQDRIRLVCLTIEEGSFGSLFFHSSKQRQTWLNALRTYQPDEEKLQTNQQLLDRLVPDKR